MLDFFISLEIIIPETLDKIEGRNYLIFKLSHFQIIKF